MALVVVGKEGPVRDIDEKPAMVGGRYLVDRRIGEGSFGVIYNGAESNGRFRVAVKFENRKTVAPQLRDEFRTYRLLNEHIRSHQNSLHQHRLSDGKQLYGGVPNVYYFGQEGLYNCLVMDLLGPSMEELFDQCGRKFAVPTVCFAAVQMIYLIEMVHSTGLIYRDIKPDNFLIGPNNLIYIIDFGMAKAYRDPRTLQHIPYREKKSLSGTARYMSINTHRGFEQSRRDDLEALGHVFLYFLRGSLPWQGLRAASNKEKYERIGLKKQDISIAELCAGLPDEFAQYLAYTRSLKFDAAPDYEMLRGLMRRVLQGRYGIADEDCMRLTNELDWQPTRSLWEPELLSAPSAADLARLKQEAAQMQARSPTLIDSAAASTLTSPNGSQAVGTVDSPYCGAGAGAGAGGDSLIGPGDQSRDAYCSQYYRCQQSPQASSKQHPGFSDSSQPPFSMPLPQSGSHRPGSSWLRRLFCL